MFGGKWEFGAGKINGPFIQDNPGNSAGFAVSSSSLEARLMDTDPWCWSDYDWTHGSGRSKAAICRIEIESLNLVTYSFVQGVDDLDNPLLGRFFVLDLQNRLYAGQLANQLELPLDSKVLC